MSLSARNSFSQISSTSLKADTQEQAPTGSEPALHWALIASSLIPAIVFGGIFSTLGVGPQIYALVAGHLQISTALATGAPALVLCAWWLHIERSRVEVQYVVGFFFTVCALVATTYAQRSMPTAPFALYIVAYPLWTMAMKRLAERTQWLGHSDGHIEAYQMYSAGWRVSMIVAGVLLVAGLTRDALYLLSGDGLPLDPTCAATGGALDCERALLMWALPYIGVLVHLLYALFLFALVDADRDDEKVLVQSLGMAAAFLLAVVWLGIELSGEASTLSRVLTMFAMSSVAGLLLALSLYLGALSEDVAQHGALLEVQLGRDLSTVKLNWTNFNRARLLRDSVSELLHSETGDWLWALLLISPAPLLFAAYVLLDAARTASHRALRACVRMACISDDVAADEPREWVSAWTLRRLGELSGQPARARSDVEGSGWLAYQLRGAANPSLVPPLSRSVDSVGKNWSAVLSKAIVLELAFVAVNVGIGKLTVLALSGLVDALHSVPIALVLLAFWAVGLVMFLLPPVPGVPVYLTGGLLITQSSREALGFGGGLALSVAVCLALKLSACYLQQEGIGRYLSGSVAVRQAVGVNSIETRAIKLILSRPGLDLRKVCVLVGGPDWPTSVLAGILRCDVRQCLLGTLPAVLVILPQCAVGAFQGPRPPVSAQTASAVLAAASLIALVPLLGAMFFINETANTRRLELLAEPLDREVLALEEAEAEAHAHYASATHWSRELLEAIDTPATAERTAGYFPLKQQLSPLPLRARLSLVCGWLAAWGAVSLVQAWDESCFRPFQITSSIAHDLDGNWLNVVLPLGWLALALSALSLGCLLAFRAWGRAATLELGELLAERLDEWCVHVQTHVSVTTQPASRENWLRGQLELQLLQQRFGRHKRASSNNMLEFYTERNANGGSQGSLPTPRPLGASQWTTPAPLR